MINPELGIFISGTLSQEEEKELILAGYIPCFLAAEGNKGLEINQ